jgi:hypothetical protein
MSTERLVARRFISRFAAARDGNPPGQTRKQSDAYEAIAKWLDAKDGDVSRMLDTLLDGFFADPWIRAKGFPVGALANDPAKYFAPPKAVRDVTRGFADPSPASAFTNPTDLDSIFGPEEPGDAA